MDHVSQRYQHFLKGGQQTRERISEVLGFRDLTGKGSPKDSDATSQKQQTGREASGRLEAGMREGRALKHRSVQGQVLAEARCSQGTARRDDSLEVRTVGLSNQVKAKKWPNQDETKV